MFEFHLNEAENELQNICFDTNHFLKDSFSIDEFLKSHRKATLEVLRNDLGRFLKVLRLSMIELINHDYEDFINLSKDLVGLNAGIDVLQAPLEQIRSEIFEVKRNVEDTINGIKHGLLDFNGIQEKKQKLYYLLEVLKSIKKLSIIPEQSSTKTLDIDSIEQASSEYIKLLFVAERCQDILSQSQTKQLHSISSYFMNTLQNIFLENLCEQNMSGLSRCIKIFDNMDKISELEDIVRKEVAVPFLYDLVNETSLQRDSKGISGIYEKILTFVDAKLIILVNADKSAKGNFLVNSLWVELAWRIEMHMSIIFAPGDPAIFRLRYLETCEFITSLKKRLRSPIDARKFDKHPKTMHFMNKWNLLVYYKIRFQEIAGQLENDMCEPAWVKLTQAHYCLKVPFSVKMCLERCWDDQVYLPQLAHSFWQISLQIISRYCVWIAEETSEENNKNCEVDSNFLINLFLDSARFSNETKEILLSKVDTFQVPQEIKHNALASIDESEAQLNSSMNFISKCIVKSLVKECVVFLTNVNDIPRLFRRTNREAPTKPCEYVEQIVKPLIFFYTENKSKVPEQVLSEWVIAVFTEISRQYLSCVNEVLENAQKTEDSLRRLKKAKDKGARSNETKGSSDDDKIRLQLVVDVHSYIAAAEKLQIKPNQISILRQLLQLVEKAKERSEKQ